MGSGFTFWTIFGVEGQPEQNGSDSSQLWGNGVGEVLSGHWSGRQKLRQVSGCTLGEYSAPTRRPRMGADDRAGLRTSTARGLPSRQGGIHAATVHERTCIHADIMDSAGRGMGIQGILRPSLGDQTTEVGVSRDYGYQQPGNHPTNPLTTKNARGTGTTRTRTVSYAPGSGSVRQPAGRASQIP